MKKNPYEPIGAKGLIKKIKVPPSARLLREVFSPYDLSLPSNDKQLKKKDSYENNINI